MARIGIEIPTPRNGHLTLIDSYPTLGANQGDQMLGNKIVSAAVAAVALATSVLADVDPIVIKVGSSGEL